MLERVSFEAITHVLIRIHSEPLDFNMTGLSRGGAQITKSRETYVKAVGTLVELASLQVSVREGLGRGTVVLMAR